MQKKALSLMLVMALVLSFMPMSYAAIDPNYEAKLIGEVGNIGSGTVQGVTFKLYLKGTSIGYNNGVANINIKVDTNKLKLVRVSNGADTLGLTSGKFGTDSLVEAPPAASAFYDASTYEDDGYVKGKAIHYLSDTSANALYLSLQPQFAGNVTAWTDLSHVITFAFAFVDGKTEDDLDMSTVQMATVDEAETLGQGAVAAIPGSSSTARYQYGVTSKGTESYEIAKPIIEYPNSDVMNLNGVKLDGVNKYVNVPVSLPDAGADVTVATTPTGYYTSDCADGTEITSGVTYTYGLQIKDDTEGATARDLTDDEKAVLSVSTDGVVTVKAGAPQATLVVSATGAYNNGKNDSTAVGTYEIGLRHGDAHSKNEEDPSVPPKPVGGEPSDKDADKTASGVAIYENVDGVETQVTISGSTTPYSKGMAIPAVGAEAKTATFVGKVVDQYGDPMNTETGTWSVTKDSAAYTDTNPAFADGVVTVASGAARGKYEYKFTSGAYNAAVEINIDDSIITWPTLTTDTIVYGQAVSEFAPTGGSIEPIAAGEVATFVWSAEKVDGPTEPTETAIDDNTVLDAGTHTLIMQCKVGEAVKSTHEYSVTVDKADQVITIAGDTDEAKRESLAIPRGGDGFDLQTKVTNETVPTATGTSNPTYAIADAETAVMGTETDKLNVITGLKINNDGTKLTITAAANDNYNEATRELTVKVGKELLDAQITLTPADNLIYAQTVTASVKQNTAQPGSLTANTEYKWQRVDNEGTATDINGATGKLVVDSDGNAADITYTAVAADIGYRLRFVVSVGTADKDNTAYEYADMTIATMTNPVGYASWGTFNPAIKTFSPTSITVTGEENAWYAVVKKPETETYAAGDDGASEVTIPDDKWVANNGAGADVVLEEDIDGNNLTPDTLYTVYMKKEAEGYQPEVKTVDQRTAKIEINDEDNPASPKGGKVEINGKAFVGETLTAVITDPVLGEGETAETKTVLSTGDIRWYRVTPAADESSEETTEEITGAAGNTTYTVDAADTDKIIRVVVTTKADAAYSGSVQAETAKVVNGHNITGVVVSYNAKDAVEYELYKIREDGTYAEPDKDNPTYDYHGIAVVAADTTTPDVQTQTFKIEGIADGTYRLIIKKTNHISFTINGLNVNGADVDLADASMPTTVQSMRLVPGDYDSNGVVNSDDLNLIADPTNYNQMDASTATNPETDLDGNGSINSDDMNIVTAPENYNVMESQCVVNLV